MELAPGPSEDRRSRIGHGAIRAIAVIPQPVDVTRNLPLLNHQFLRRDRRWSTAMTSCRSTVGLTVRFHSPWRLAKIDVGGVSARHLFDRPDALQRFNTVDCARADRPTHLADFHRSDMISAPFFRTSDNSDPEARQRCYGFSETLGRSRNLQVEALRKWLWISALAPAVQPYQRQ